MSRRRNEAASSVLRSRVLRLRSVLIGASSVLPSMPPLFQSVERHFLGGQFGGISVYGTRSARFRCQLYLRRFIAMTRWGFLSALLLIWSQFCLAQAPATNGEAAVPAVLTYEQHKQAAIRLNDLAGRIHSESDASAFVSEIAGLFAKSLPPAWASGRIRQRVARAEYEQRRPAR